MSYRSARSKLSYAQRRMRKQLPSLNSAFRSAWESNIEKALARVEELRALGWAVDVEEGALTADQADHFASTAENMGCEVERIPVAEWGTEELKDLTQFVAYKPKEPGVEAPTIMPEQVQEKPQKKPMLGVSPEQVMNAYVKAFLGGRTLDPGAVKSGFIIEPSHIAALIPWNAQVTPTTDAFVEKARKTIPNSTIIEEFDNTSKVRQALRNARKATPAPKYVTLGGLGGEGNHVKIDYFEKALRVLGGGKIRVHAEKENEPAFIVNTQGDIVVIAPGLNVDDTERISFGSVRPV